MKPMKKLLFVNSCVNREVSRTNRIACELLSLVEERGSYAVEECILEEENLMPLRTESLNRRFQLATDGTFTDPIFRYAHQFRTADCIIIAAPYWDLGFPALLKTYIEAISIPGLLYDYKETGPVGRCRAQKMYYVTTRGGLIEDAKDLGFVTICALGKLFGIRDIKCISLGGLDLPADDLEGLIEGVIEDLPRRM
jgi:FMN-dependent NADH-azoreductase